MNHLFIDRNTESSRIWGNIRITFRYIVQKTWDGMMISNKNFSHSVEFFRRHARLDFLFQQIKCLCHKGARHFHQFNLPFAFYRNHFGFFTWTVDCVSFLLWSLVPALQDAVGSGRSMVSVATVDAILRDIDLEGNTVVHLAADSSVER